MTPGRERWYGWLLRLYPRDYRRERGPEMLGTMLEAGESGRPRPAGREIAGLVAGALRMRAGVPAGVSPGRLWLSALRLAVLFLLAQGTADSLARAGLVVQRLLGGDLHAVNQLGFPAGAAAGGLGLVAFAYRRYLAGLLGAGVGCVALPLAHLPMGMPLRYWPLVAGAAREYLTFPFAVLLAVPLLRRRCEPAPRRPLAWLVAVPLALLLLPSAFDATLHWQPGALYAVAAGCLLWTVIDPRVPVAAAALLLGSALPLVGFDLLTTGYDSAGRVDRTLLYLGLRGVVVALVLLGAGALRIPRQARL